MDFSNESIAAIKWNGRGRRFYVGTDCLFLYAGKRRRTWYCLVTRRGKGVMTKIGAWPQIDFAEAKRRARIYRDLIKKNLTPAEIDAAIQCSSQNRDSLWIVKLTDGRCRVVLDQMEYRALRKRGEITETLDISGQDAGSLENMSRQLAMAARTRQQNDASGQNESETTPAP